MRLYRSLAMGALLLLPLHAAAGTYYVSPSGCSNSGPGSSSHPWCSINSGANKLSAGDTLYVRNGTYKEQVKVNRSGAAGKPIVIAAASGHKPVIEGKSKSLYEAGLIDIYNRKYITLRGITVRNSSYYCIQITGSDNIVVERMVVNGCYHGGLVFDEGCSNVKALHNDIQKTDKCGTDCGTHEAITISDTAGFEVAYNYVHHGIKEGIDAKDGSKNGTVHDNVVAYMGQVGIYLNHCVNVRFYRNNVHHNGSSGFQLAVGDYAMGAHKTDNNQIYQNLSWSNGYNGVEYWAEGSGSINNNKIYNNVFYGNKHYGVQLSDDDSQVKGTVLRNNIIFNNSMGGIVGSAKSGSTMTHNLFHQNSPSGSSFVTGNPLFVNLSKGDFHLSAGSPAIDKGYDMGLPKKNKPDIGAYEYGYVAPKLDQGPNPKKDQGPNPKKDKGPNPKKDTGPPKHDIRPPPGREAGTPPYKDQGSGIDDPTLAGSCGCGVGVAPGWSLLGLMALLLGIARRRRG